MPTRHDLSGASPIWPRLPQALAAHPIHCRDASQSELGGKPLQLQTQLTPARRRHLPNGEIGVWKGQAAILAVDFAIPAVGQVFGAAMGSGTPRTWRYPFALRRSS